VRQLENKALDIVDARCNHEVYNGFYSCGSVHRKSYFKWVTIEMQF